MIKLLCANSGPSFRTLAQTEFINALNEKGLKAELYGEALWPQTKCAFKPLSQFKPQLGDIIINDGLLIQSYFDLQNLGFNRYSFGRKKRLLSLAGFILNFLVHPIWLIRNIKFILYKPNRFQTNVKLYAEDLTKESGFNFCKLIDFEGEKFDVVKNQLMIFQDITASNNIHSQIKDAKAETVVLAGAIRDSLYFTEKIIPMINARTKNLQYVGLNSSFDKKVNRSKDFEAQIKTWISLF